MYLFKILRNTLLFLILVNASKVFAETEACIKLLNDFEQAEQGEDLEAMNTLIRTLSRNKGISCSFTVNDLTVRANEVEQKLVAEAERKEFLSLEEAKALEKRLQQETQRANEALGVVTQATDEARLLVEAAMQLPTSGVSSYVVPGICVLAICGVGLGVALYAGYITIPAALAAARLQQAAATATLQAATRLDRATQAAALQTVAARAATVTLQAAQAAAALLQAAPAAAPVVAVPVVAAAAAAVPVIARRAVDPAAKAARELAKLQWGLRK